jgi:two-component system, chemotaxis family, CheB/CheR fusion protein
LVARAIFDYLALWSRDLFRLVSAPQPRDIDPAVVFELVNLSSEAILAYRERDGTICFWSRGAEALYGWSRDEALGQSAFGLLRTVTSDAPDEMVAKLRSMGRWEGDLLNWTRDGRWLPIATDCRAQVDERGDLTTVVRRDRPRGSSPAMERPESPVEDESARTALRASEQRVRRLVDSNIIGITLGDLEGRIIEANDALLSMVGYSRADLQAGRLRWDAITPSEYLPRDAVAIAQAQEVGVVPPWEKEYIRKDGTRVPVMVGLAMLDEREGTTVAFIIDLTEQKRGEAERNRLVAENQRQQALLEAVFKATPTCLLVATGPELTVRYANPAFIRLMLHSDRLRIGVPLPEAWPEIRDSALLPATEHVVRTGLATAPTRYETTRADGTRASFEFHVIGMRWLEEPGALLALWDTTPLEEAREAAEAAVRIRDDFIAVASHELKTPTTALLALSQLARSRLRRGKVLERQQVADLVDVMEWESQRLNMLTARLLDTSRIQAGTFALECEPTDIVALIRNIIRAAKPAQSVNFTAPDVLVANVDPLRVEQVVRNLLDNAIKYGGATSPVDISLSMQRPETAVLAVRDYGPGIAPEHRAHIFEQFYRANRTAAVPGMGLGLHITHQIVVLHGGSIAAEFPADGGTRFIVRLPTQGHPTDARG